MYRLRKERVWAVMVPQTLGRRRTLPSPLVWERLSSKNTGRGPLLQKQRNVKFCQVMVHHDDNATKFYPLQSTRLFSSVAEEDEETEELKSNKNKNDTKVNHSRSSKKEINQLKNAARSIPYWLGNDPDCFTWTMEALQLNPSNSMEYRQLYIDSLASFYETMTNSDRLKAAQSSSSSSRTTACLERLVDAGFDDLLCAKQFRKMNTFHENRVLLERRLEKKSRQHDDRLAAIQLSQEIIRQLEEERRQVLVNGVDDQEEDDDIDDNINRYDGDENDEQSASETELSAEATKDDSPTNGFFSNFAKSVSSLFKSTEPLPTTSSESPVVAVEKPLLTRRMRERLGIIHEKIEKQESQLQKEQYMLVSTKEQLKRIGADLDALDPVMPPEEYDRISITVKNVLKDICPELAIHMQSRHRRTIEQYQVLDSKTDLTKPHEWYMHARLDQRTIIFHGGPTNSGKTYSALQRLKEAKRGLYVGPLRLLAAEIYETLSAQGIYTNLYTGQESREIAFSTHVAATVELAPTNEDFDVVVIDEIQMMEDSSRGYAWTRALMGVRSKEVHVCGGLEAETLVRKIAKACGDNFELREYERFSPLHVAEKSLSPTSKMLGSYRNVEPGDCVVAFSRADIFAIKREIEQGTDYKCCIIYGSLPPETRSQQARLFNNPDSGYDILVASDAIGMGLNLNIRRIIFNSMYKSNGESIIQLDHSSVKQIAGRAGRRNSPFPNGEVTCRDPEDMPYLRKCMDSEIQPIAKAGLLPTPIHVELFSEALQTYGLSNDHLNLHKLMGQFSELAKLQGDFFLCRQRELLSIARTFTDLNIPLRDKYVMCMSPINVRNERAMATLRKFAVKLSLGEVSGLSRMTIPKKATSFDDMALLCEVHTDLDLFLWLNQRFPGNVMEQQSAMAMKEVAINLINKGLRDTDTLRLNHCYIRRDTHVRSMARKTLRDDEGNGFVGRNARIKNNNSSNPVRRRPNHASTKKSNHGRSFRYNRAA